MRSFVSSFVLLCALAALADAQTVKATSTTESVLMLSDIHFDPYRNPTLVPKLVASPVKEWPSILATPTTPATEQAFAQLQQSCKAAGIDTDYTLLTSSLAAEHKQMPAPLFVTISGDLMAHVFDCKFKALAPGGSEKDYSDFAAKTVAFVAQQLHNTFPRTPIYFALGNNDSGCKDYREDTNSSFLRNDGRSFASIVQDKTNAADINAEFSAYGDYEVTLPKPFMGTRLLVMQDIFETKKYAACDGKEAPEAGSAQIAWLRGKLDAARAKHERVWIMAHVPPGVDAYTTLTKGSSSGSCPYSNPTLFVNSDLFAEALRDYTDVVSLAILGHTHMDEMRLFNAKDGSGAIPGKLIPSISPIVGNNPSFTVGAVDPERSMLVDYTVYVASNKTGVDTTWTPEYTFSSVYGQPDYSTASLKAITDGLVSSQSGTTLVEAYTRNYFAAPAGAGLNIKAAALAIVWPIYACTLTHNTAQSFTDCACPAKQPQN